MAVLPSGLSPDFLSDGAADILDRQDKPKLELVKDTVTGDLTPPKVAQVAPPVKETTTTDPVAAARERAQRKFDREQELKKLEEEEKKAKGAASKAEYAKVLAQYEPQLNAPAPKFESPKESFTQIAGLGMMMMMLGSMAGGKTYGSAIGAMNGIAGMMKGYQEGRKEAYDRAKVEFEENLKQWKENKAQVKETFQRALKLGSKDISKATAEVVSELTAKGETTVADLVKKNGLPNVAQAFNQASDNADRHLDAVQSAVARTSAPVGERRVLAGAPPTPDTPEKPKTRAERMKQLRDELLAIEREETGLTAEQEARKVAGASGTPMKMKYEGKTVYATKAGVPLRDEEGKLIEAPETGGAASRAAAEKIKGQSAQLRAIIGDDINELGPTEIPIISARAESAKETKELADEIRSNPFAAGVVGKTLSFLDKYIPSRYKDATSETEYSPGRVAAEAVNNPEIFENMTPDQISKARLIQKKVLDLINARTQAVSNRFLVSELNMQKNVLDITGMSAETAAAVYEGLAEDDVKSLRRFAGSNTIKKISDYAGLGNKRAETKKKSVEERFKELVGQNMTEDDIYETLKKEGY